jgi:hypothetical protein
MTDVAIELMDGPGGGARVTIEGAPREGRIVRVPRAVQDPHAPEGKSWRWDSYRLELPNDVWQGRYVGGKP